MERPEQVPAGQSQPQARAQLAERSLLVIDLDQGTVSSGPWSTTFESGSDLPDEVIARYLALVYEMRGLEPGTAIPLRSLDISVLARALHLPAPEVVQRLEILMTPGDGRVERARALLPRRLAISAAGVLVAVTAAGALLLLPASADAAGGDLGREVARLTTESGLLTGSGVQVAPPGADEPEIGEGLTIER